MKTKLIKKGRGVGRSKSGPSEEELDKILEETIEEVPEKETPPKVDKREEVKDLYVEYLNDNYDEAWDSFRKLSYLPRREYKKKEFSDLTDEQKDRLGKYTQDAINVREYVNQSDLLSGLGETMRIPERSKSLNVGIILLYEIYPFLALLGTQSPEEGEEIKEAVERMREMKGLDLNPQFLSLDDFKSKSMDIFTKDLKRLSPPPKATEGELDGGRKSKTKKKGKKSTRKRRRKTKKGKKIHRKRKSIKKKMKEKRI